MYIYIMQVCKYKESIFILLISKTKVVEDYILYIKSMSFI